MLRYFGFLHTVSFLIGLGLILPSYAGTYSININGNSNTSDQFNFTACAYVDSDCGTSPPSGGCLGWVSSGGGHVAASIGAGSNICLALQVQQPPGYSVFGMNVNEDTYWFANCQGGGILTAATTGLLDGGIPSGIYAMVVGQPENITINMSVTLNSWTKSTGAKTYSYRSFIVNCSVNNSPKPST